MKKSCYDCKHAWIHESEVIHNAEYVMRHVDCTSDEADPTVLKRHDEYEAPEFCGGFEEGRLNDNELNYNA